VVAGRSESRLPELVAGGRRDLRRPDRRIRGTVSATLVPRRYVAWQSHPDLSRDIVHPGEVISAVVRAAVQALPKPLRRRWTRAMDAGRFDIRWLGADLANPETQRFEAFLTDGGTPTSVMFPIYDLGPFLDLPETLDDVRNARQLCVTFVDAMRSGDLERCSSMASLDEEFLRTSKASSLSRRLSERENRSGKATASRSSSWGGMTRVRSDHCSHCGSRTRPDGGRSSDTTARTPSRSAPTRRADHLVFEGSGVGNPICLS
jgi:hypothetical protein